MRQFKQQIYFKKKKKKKKKNNENTKKKKREFIKPDLQHENIEIRDRPSDWPGSCQKI